MCPKDADRMASSADPDQTAPLEAVSSGSTLFARFVCLKTKEHYDPVLCFLPQTHMYQSQPT